MLSQKRRVEKLEKQVTFGAYDASDPEKWVMVYGQPIALSIADFWERYPAGVLFEVTEKDSQFWEQFSIDELNELASGKEGPAYEKYINLGGAVKVEARQIASKER